MAMLCSKLAEALLQIGFPSKYPTCPAGFYRSAGCFFTFYLVCVGSMLQMSAVYRLMAAASPNMDIASAAGEVQLTHSSKFALVKVNLQPTCRYTLSCANDSTEGLAASRPRVADRGRWPAAQSVEHQAARKICLQALLVWPAWASPEGVMCAQVGWCCCC